jgi:hypothetical protein
LLRFSAIGSPSLSLEHLAELDMREIKALAAEAARIVKSRALAAASVCVMIGGCVGSHSKFFDQSASSLLGNRGNTDDGTFPFSVLDKFLRSRLVSYDAVVDPDAVAASGVRPTDWDSLDAAASASPPPPPAGPTAGRPRSRL